MRAEKVEQLSQDLLHKTGIDFQNYNTEGLIDEILDVLNFPNLAFRFLLRPILIAVFLLVLCIVVLALMHKPLFGIVLFAIVGLFAFIGSGGFTGAVLLIRKLRKDLKEVFQIIFRITNGIIRDFGNRGIAKADASRQKVTVREVLNGVVFIILMPVAKSVTKEMIPFVGGFVYRIFHGLIGGVMKRVIGIKETDEEIDTADIHDAIPLNEKNVAVLEAVQKKTEFIIAGTGTVVSIPIIVLGFGFVCFSCLALWLVMYFFL